MAKAKLRTLTPKRREFAEAVLDGESLVDAYAKAYPGTAMSRKAMRIEACRVAKDPMVKAHIEQGRATIVEARQADRLIKRGLLFEIMADRTKAPADRIRAIEVDNKMTGENAPQQINVFGLTDLLAMVRRKSEKPVQPA